MRINTLISSGSYSRKLLVLYFLLFSDIFCNTFIVFCDFTEGLNEKYSKNTAAENGMMIGQLLNVLQCVFQLGLIFWFFFLIWKTFLFRFGLLGMLFREFRTFFLLLPANFTMFLVERLYRMYYTMEFTDASTEDAISIWDDTYYVIFFWIRLLSNIYAYIYSNDDLLSNHLKSLQRSGSSQILQTRKLVISRGYILKYNFVRINKE